MSFPWGTDPKKFPPQKALHGPVQHEGPASNRKGAVHPASISPVLYRQRSARPAKKGADSTGHGQRGARRRAEASRPSRRRFSGLATNCTRCCSSTEELLLQTLPSPSRRSTRLPQERGRPFHSHPVRRQPAGSVFPELSLPETSTTPRCGRLVQAG